MSRASSRVALAAAIRRAIVTGQETPGEIAERVLADPEALPDYEAAVEALEHANKYANLIYENREWSESDLLEIIHATDDALGRLREGEVTHVR